MGAQFSPSARSPKLRHFGSPFKIQSGNSTSKGPMQGELSVSFRSLACLLWYLFRPSTFLATPGCQLPVIWKPFGVLRRPIWGPLLAFPAVHVIWRPLPALSIPGSPAPCWMSLGGLSIHLAFSGYSSHLISFGLMPRDR